MTTSPSPDSEAVLEKNVESLLGSAYDPPAIDRGARVRIREALVASGERATARPTKRPTRWSPMMMAGTALVAGSVIAAVASGVIDRGGGGSAGPAGVVKRDGQRVELADGTVAVIAEGGTIDAVGARHVRVRGQVYLDVAPGKGRFVVDTEHGQLAVLGTRFVVTSGDDETTAAVLRGAVKMTSGGSDVVVRAGQQGTMKPGAVPTRGPAPRLSHLAGWAAAARIKAEDRGPRRRSGTLYARNPQWQEQDFPLPMRQLTVDVVVENQVARVALDQTFHNPRPETLEGVYRFSVPSDAALARLAMYVEGTLMESAVVERQQARRIYEDIVYKRRDPALAEWTGAGRVDMRIFPLVGHQDKRVILAYTQPLPRLYDDWTLTVPLPDLDDPVDAVGMKVRIADCGTCEIHSPSHAVEVVHDGDAAVVTYARAGAEVGDSLVLTVRDPDRDARVASAREGDQQYLLIRSRPDLADGAVAGEYRPRRWVILDDVSASRGPFERRAQADLIDRLIDTIDEDDQIAIATFDVSVRRQGDFVRAADIDRRAVRSFLLGERGGVGATDLGLAFGEAVAQLTKAGATDARDAYVVYLGDGVVTGGARDLAILKDKLVGKATLVAFGIGDGSDLPSLGAVADATGGMVVSIDPADDLGWRALDAVAALYTPRVVGLRTRVLDADGRMVEGATAYLRGGQLAEGDELELAVRAPAGARISAVEIEGTRDGAAWTHRIDLTAATHTATASAGYAPRLWAQRHVQALILARNTAPPPVPCVGSPCPTFEEQRSSYRETLRKEIVALGKQFFLLSPHTSLIVLENDAMYDEYKVTKGVNGGWAPYQVPAKIKVTPSTAPTALGDREDVALRRTPVQVFYSYAQYYGRGWDQGIVTESSETGWRAGGNTRFGTSLSGGTGSLVLRGQRENERQADDDGGATTKTPTNQPARDDIDAKGPAEKPPSDSAAASTVTTVPVTGANSQPIAGGDASGDLFFDLVTTDQLNGHATSWEVNQGFLGSAQLAKQQAGRWDGRDRSSGESIPYWGGVPYPVAWNYASDYRLDDLTEFVPGFFADEIDDAIAELRYAAGGAKGTIDDGARAMLVAARAHIPAGMYRWGDGPEIRVDSAGRLSWTVTHGSGLVEAVRFDGQHLVRRYDELGLELTRDLGEGSPALLMTVLPLLVPDADHLARWYVVAKKDANTITLAPASAPDEPTIELELDGDRHLVAMRTASGRTLITIRWDGGVPVGASYLGEALTVSHQVATLDQVVAPISSSLDAPVAVALPLRPPAYWTNRREKMTAGTDEWRRATRNLMASQAATADGVAAVATLRELDSNGGIELGDLALASGGLGRATTDDDLVKLLAAAGDRGRVVGRYLSASRAYGKKPRPGVFAAIEDGGLVGTLASHRTTLAYLEAGKLDRAVDRLNDGRGITVLKVIAAATIASNYAYQSPKSAEAWDAVAEGAWRNVARYEAARTLYNRGDYASASTRFAELMTSYDPDALPVQIDWTAKSAMQSSPRGQVGWQLAWSAYRNQALDHGDLGQVMALLTSAMQIGEPDVDRVLGRAAELAAGDPAALAGIVEQALALNQIDRAAPLLEDALAKEQTPRLLRLAAQVAERQGRIADAADYLDKALLGDGDAPVALSALRADMTHLLALRGRIALLATGATREAGLDACLVISDRWRDVDPDNIAIDRQIGEILLAGGRRDEAWRQLSTAIERRPTEGDGWSMVAEVMEKEGRLDDALTYWQQAIVIDQTNPTWRMRKAQTLFALGRDDDGKQLLEQVAQSPWHDRFGNVKYQAQSMLQQMQPAP